MIFNSKEYHKKYYQQHKEKICAQSIKWQKDNPDKHKLNQKKSREKPEHKKYIHEFGIKWREKHKEILKQKLDLKRAERRAKGLCSCGRKPKKQYFKCDVCLKNARVYAKNKKLSLL